MRSAWHYEFLIHVARVVLERGKRVKCEVAVPYYFVSVSPYSQTHWLQLKNQAFHSIIRTAVSTAV
jgi:hypothetical protein